MKKNLWAFSRLHLWIILISFQELFSKIWVTKLAVRLVCECGLSIGVYGIKKHYIEVGCLVRVGKLLKGAFIGGCTNSGPSQRKGPKGSKHIHSYFPPWTSHKLIAIYIIHQYLGLLRNTQRQTAVQREFPSCLGWKKHNMD